MVSSQVAPVRAKPTIFGNILERNVVFLLDTSGSMYHCLDVVREHLIEILFFRATSGQDTMFNVIEFNEEVTKWADRMVQCTPRTVSVASEWINKLQCGTSTNTMGALLEAYDDDGMQAIYLVTDGMPDQRPGVIIENVRKLHKGRPIHAIYLCSAKADVAAVEFLEDLAKETNGSLHVISLTMFGRIQKVTPVFNQKSEFLRSYSQDLLSPNITPTFSSDENTKSNIDFNNYSYSERPTSAPPASGFVPRLYDPKTFATVLKAPHGSVPIPYVSWSKFEKPRGYSNVLNYADSVLASRGLAQFVDKVTSSVPVAASVMKGVQVLAKRDSDGLYYMGTITDQGERDQFVIEFHKCPALRKPHVQETPVQDFIAYKDAVRQHVCLGDKVLAPWQPDGRYGPGTVIDGVDTRDLQPPGYEDKGHLLVTFYNGQTVEIGAGVAVRIPLALFDRLVTELQLPESQRRKITIATDSTPPVYDGRAPPAETTWQRPFSPPKSQRRNNVEDNDARLKAKIKTQLDRNRHLLERANLNQEGEWVRSPSPTNSLRSVHFKDSMDSGHCENLGDLDFIESESEESVEMIDVAVGTETDFEKYVGRPMPVGVPLTKAGGHPQEKKRWRWWSSGLAPRPPRFRETLMSCPAEPRDEKPHRPGHQEYMDVAGVPFPAKTDNKAWHPYHGHTVRAPVETEPSYHQPPRGQSNGQATNAQRANPINGDPQVKHHEYQSSAGVPFPPATDRKFATSGNQNWDPSQAGQRSAQWEDGLGHGDTRHNMKERLRLDRKRHVAEQYEGRIQRDAAVQEMKEASRLDNHRKNINARNQQIAETAASKQQAQAERLSYKRDQAANHYRKESERQEQADGWKHERIEAMKQRAVQHENMEKSFEKAAQDYAQQKQEGFNAHCSSIWLLGRV
ncbi:uncharacterized protein LOC5513500 isoform X2 [Nematostella vectensis]|uniref:uncharacterized protein LOC5513500 isoform X2 n=1 Tax=Nematostella vectensis TaxID=45351 RepID=UPI0020777A85|nr:uncharacterized protein LOC5513500 isoform X2 [Nematostella vectensis]